MKASVTKAQAIYELFRVTFSGEGLEASMLRDVEWTAAEVASAKLLDGRLNEIEIVLRVKYRPGAKVKE